MQFIYSLDKFSPEIKLNYDRHASFRSVPGVITTLVYYLSLVALFIQITVTFWSTKEPSINQLLEVTKSFETLNLVEAKMLPVIFLNINNSMFDARSVFQLSMIRSKVIDDIHPEDIYLNLVYCSQILNETDYFKDVTINNVTLELIRKFGICVDTRNETINQKLFISGSKGDKEYQHLTFNVETKDGNPKPVTSLVMHLSLGWITASTKLNDYRNLTHYEFNYQSYALVQKSTKVISTLGTTTVVQNDHGWPYEKKEAARIGNMNLINSYTEVDDNASKLYLRFELKPDNRVNRVTRGYETLLNSLGNFGGIRELLFVTVTILYGLLFKTDQSAVAEEVFKLKELEVQHQALNTEPRKKPTKNSLLKSLWSCECCKKKKNKLSPEQQKRQEDAFLLIENCLDIRTLIKSVNLTTMMSKMFLPERDEALVPVCSLALFQKERNAVLNRDQDVACLPLALKVVKRKKTVNNLNVSAELNNPAQRRDLVEPVLPEVPMQEQEMAIPDVARKVANMGTGPGSKFGLSKYKKIVPAKLAPSASNQLQSIPNQSEPKEELQQQSRVRQEEVKDPKGGLQNVGDEPKFNSMLKMMMTNLDLEVLELEAKAKR